MSWRSVVSKCVVTEPEHSASTAVGSDLVAVLIGWAGSKDDHLAKYSRIYEQRRLTTVRYTVTLPVLALRQLAVPPQYSQPLLAELERLKAIKSRRILLHLFSMNSLFVLNSILLKQSDFLKNVHGVILDSCPSLTGLEPYGRVLDMDLPQRFPKLGPYSIAVVKFILMQIALWIECKNVALDAVIGKMEKRRIYYWVKNLVTLPKQQLYIYSKADTFCPYESITRFYEDQASRNGVVAKQVLLDNSPHVGHLPVYPDIYESAVNQMVDKLLYSEKKDLSQA